MSDLTRYLKGRISEDLGEATDIIAERTGVKRPGGPQAFFTLCNRSKLRFEMDYKLDTFKVWYDLPAFDTEESKNEDIEVTIVDESNQPPATEEQENTPETTEEDDDDDIF